MGHARQRHEAAQEALQQLEAAEQRGMLQLQGLPPNIPEAVALAQQLHQNRAQMQPVRETKLNARDQLDRAESWLRMARLAQLCAMGADAQAANVMAQVWPDPAPARQQQREQGRPAPRAAG